MSANPNESAEGADCFVRPVVTFSDLPLQREILYTLAHLEYVEPTPIQAQAIPATLEGHDVLGLAQTGTGKTAAFLLPIIEKLIENGRAIREATPFEPQALVLAPTRELALQIAVNMRAYSQRLRLRHTVIVGGVSQSRQVEEMRRGAHIVIATPGRLLDLMNQGAVRLSGIETIVLDEADRMLDIGFLPVIRRIVAALPQKRQTLFFSATMPAAVAGLANEILRNPVRVEVAPESTPVERICQSVIMVPHAQKRQVLVDLMANDQMERVIIFTRTKHGADKVAKLLTTIGVSTGAMHGRKSQAQRQNVLRAFSQGKIRALVATDVAARGIDVNDITHVINYELPHEPESYVHRIGRTARAGREGAAIALCGEGDEKVYLRQIERLTKQKIVVANRPEASGVVAPPQRGANAPAVDEDCAEDRRGGRLSSKNKTKRGARPEARNRARDDGGALNHQVDFAEEGQQQETLDAPRRKKFHRGQDPESRRRRNQEEASSRFSAGRSRDDAEKPSFSRKPSSRLRDERHGGMFGGEEARSANMNTRGSDRPDRPDRADRPARFDRSDRPDRADRPARFDRSDRPDRADRPARFDRSDRPDRTDRPARFDRSDRSDRPDRAQDSFIPPHKPRGAGADRRKARPAVASDDRSGARPFGRRGAKPGKRR